MTDIETKADSPAFLMEAARVLNAAGSDYSLVAGSDCSPVAGSDCSPVAGSEYSWVAGSELRSTHP